MKQKKKRTIDIQFVTATISTSLVLLLLGAVVLVVLSAQSLSNHVRENLTLSLLLNDEVAQKDVDRIITYVNAQSYTKEIQYISKEDILAEQTESMGLDPTEFLGYNPYTASIEVKLKAAYANSDSIAPIKNRLMRYTQIREISYPSELMDNVNDNIRKISAVLLSLALALSLISFALINNTIKLTIYSQRFLLHTMKLVGASWAFIRKPFLLRNLAIGIVSGVLANGIMAGSIMLLLRYEPQMSYLFTSSTLSIVGATVMAVGILITWVCAYISINRFLKMKAGDLYYI
ncbi:MAG: permease-like cell division protein FtsX [Bacteroidaceae bacterium]|nr:permease-like cell division protein FtsX [Bacteroidaceae bacterium]MBR5149195.1 permease-like cell division protein FtsX [Bacteroidaceae bacterium]